MPVKYTQKEKEELSSITDGTKSYTRKSVVRSTYANAENHIFVRDKLRRESYSSYGEDDDFCLDTRKNIVLAMLAYKKNGIIRDAVDLGGDFACKGIRFINKNKKDQKFLEEWAKKVDVAHVSERFCNMLLRCSNLVLQRSYAKVNKLQRKKIEKGLSVGEEGPGKRRIPFSYAINSPLNITVLGNAEISAYSGKINYGYIIPPSVITGYKDAKDNAFVDLDILPEAIADAIKKGEKNAPIDPDKTRLYFYKKDDWEIWAEPICSTILDDVQILEKSKVADMACLDGIASGHVRVWLHGDLEHKIIPTQAMLDKFASLMEDGGNGQKDIFWNPALKVIETGTEQYKFLGSDKNASALRAVYEGMGIPHAITGTDGSIKSALSLKVMVERLTYVRTILVKFWQQELAEIEQAMDLTPGTEIAFDHINLTDETAEKALYIQMYDRNMISLATVQRKFGEQEAIELIQQNREQKEIESGKRVTPVGQWKVTGQEHDLNKIALQSGQATPAEVGLELKPNRKDQKRGMEMKALSDQKKPGGQPQQGRPPNSKDKKKRTRTTKAFISELAEAKRKYNEIAEVFTPIYLQYTGKKNVRSLTEAQWEYGENVKFAALCSSNGRSAQDTLADDNISVPSSVLSTYKSMIKEDMTIEEKRDLMCAVYVKEIALNRVKDSGE